MGSQFDRQLSLIAELIGESGKLASQIFYNGTLEVYIKEDGSKVTNIDLAVSNYTVNTAASKGIGVRSEEKGSTAQYGENGVLDSDPTDSTNDLIEGYKRQPRHSNAAPSLGFWDQEPVAGAVIFPLLGVAPIKYLASKGGGAYREQNGRNVRLKIDTTPTRGVVFVSSKTHTPEAQAISGILKQMGYTPIPEHGAVFKASSLADRELLKQYPYNGVHALGIPVVGFISRVHLHDIAAVTCIIREAGGITTSPQNRAGKQPWVAANNPTVFSDLMNVVAATSV
jgi:fructose-1,6-bisphosphatase/inositol monophosphatase family enzyme